MAKAKKSKLAKGVDLRAVARSLLRLIAAVNKLADQQRMSREAVERALLELQEARATYAGIMGFDWTAPRLSDAEMAEQLRQAEGG